MRISYRYGRTVDMSWASRWAEIEAIRQGLAHMLGICTLIWKQTHGEGTLRTPRLMVQDMYGQERYERLRTVNKQQRTH